jgi:hypothetical protein
VKKAAEPAFARCSNWDDEAGEEALDATGRNVKRALDLSSIGKYE